MAMPDVVRSLAVLGATIGGVAITTFVLAGLMAPNGTAQAGPTVTPEPSFDVVVAPEVVGGRLQVTGDRSGTFVLDTTKGNVSYQPREDGAISLVQGETFLSGPEGRIAFDPTSGEITQIDFMDMAFYIDPGECTVTVGEQNPDSGLMSASVECTEIADIRDKGVVSIAGVVAVPGSVFRAKAHLPAPSGTLDLGDTAIDLAGATGLMSGSQVVDTERLPVTVHAADGNTFVTMELDAQAGGWFLTGAFADGAYIEVTEPCPAEAEDLGVLNEWTTVMSFTFDCDGIAPTAGGDGSVTGSLVVDMIDQSKIQTP